MKFLGIMAHINKIGDVWRAAMAKGKLEVEETKDERTQIWFVHFAQKNSFTNLIIKNYWVVKNSEIFIVASLRQWVMSG